MTVFIADREITGVTPELLGAIQVAARRTSERFTTEGRPVRYLGSIHLPTDTRLLCLFEAADALDVRDVNEAAQLPFARIVKVFELEPPSSVREV